MPAALAALSMPRREALSLRVGQGLGVEETAATMAVPTDIVANLVSTALVHMRDHLLNHV